MLRLEKQKLEQSVKRESSLIQMIKNNEISKKLYKLAILILFLFLSILGTLSIWASENQLSIQGSTNLAQIALDEEQGFTLMLEVSSNDPTSEEITLTVKLPEEVSIAAVDNSHYDTKTHSLVTNIKLDEKGVYVLNQNLLMNKEARTKDVIFQVTIANPNGEIIKKEIRESFNQDEEKLESTTTIEELEPTDELKTESSEHENGPDDADEGIEKDRTSDSSQTQSSETEQKLSNVGQSTVRVSSWREFYSAYENEEVTSIQLTDSIEEPSYTEAVRLPIRKKSLEIDGDNHKLYLKNVKFVLDSHEKSSFILKNFSEIGYLNQQTLNKENQSLITGSTNKYPFYTSGWTIEIQNVNSPTGNQAGLVNHPGSQLLLSGEVNWQTNEMFAAIKGVEILAHAKVRVHKNHSQSENTTPFFHFERIPGHHTRSDRFLVRRKATVIVTSSNKSEDYPIVSGYYNQIYLEKQADFIGQLPGSLIRAEEQASDFIAEGENRIYLESTKSGVSPIVFNHPGSKKLTIGTGSEFVLKGQTSRALIEEQSQDTTLLFENLKSFNFENKHKTEGKVFSKNLTKVTFLKTAMQIWEATNPKSQPTYAHPFLEQVMFERPKNSIFIQPEDAQLRRFLEGEKIYKIVGDNTEPHLTLETATTANQNLYAKVKRENVLSGIDKSGNILTQPQNFGMDHLVVTIIDSYGKRHSKQVDTEGHVTFDTKRLQKKEGRIEAWIERGTQRLSVIESLIVDVTPPEPVQFDKGQRITPDTPMLTGKAEANVQLFTIVNGQVRANATSSDANGHWEIPLTPLKLNSGDQLQVQAFDGEVIKGIDRKELATYVEGQGNGNPLKEDFYYRSAIFFKASSLSVEGRLAIRQLPNHIYFGSRKISAQEEHYWGQLTQEVLIEDSRTQSMDWQLKLTTKNSSDNDFYGLLYYVENNQERLIDEGGVVITTKSIIQKNIYQTQFNNNDTGIRLQIPVEKQQAKRYQGSVRWHLQIVPVNE